VVGVAYRSHAHQRNSVSRGIPSPDEFEQSNAAGQFTFAPGRKAWGVESRHGESVSSTALDLEGRFGIGVIVGAALEETRLLLRTITRPADGWKWPVGNQRFR
jgi:hypothetical protein